MTSVVDAETVEEKTYLFPYSWIRSYPIATRSYGVHIEDEHGNVYLDASGGPAAISVGHSVPEVVAAMAEQASQLSYAHSSQFQTRVGQELAEMLAAKFLRTAFGALGRPLVVFTSGGSEANETALKIVRQYWLARNAPEKTKILSRAGSYHGATMGALGISGNLGRRRPYLPLLGPGNHAAACYCYRCSFNKTYPECGLECGEDLIRRMTDRSTAAVFVEPVVGASSGAVPPDQYFPRIRAACDRHEVLLVVDEVMTGCGKTGKFLAIEHWDVEPDVVVMGKGLSSGHAPLGAVILSPKIADVLGQAKIFLDHSFTYQCHPPSLAAGLAVQRIIERDHLVETGAETGAYLKEQLFSLRDRPDVGDVRGMGLMWTVEFVADKSTRIPYPRSLKFSELLFGEMRRRGVLIYPGGGAAGEAGDHILITPPLIFERGHVDELVAVLRDALDCVHKGLVRSSCST